MKNTFFHERSSLGGATAADAEEMVGTVENNMIGQKK